MDIDILDTLSANQKNRLQCVQAAWLVLNDRDGKVDLIDLHSLAFYIETGKDPYGDYNAPKKDLTEVPDDHPALFTT